MSDCPDDERLSMFLDGALTGAERDAVEAHLDTCPDCRRLVGAAAPASEMTPPGVDGGAVLGRGAAIGRYLVLTALGRGGMGVVYAAYDSELDRRVALKFLHAIEGSADARRLLVREARALGRLSHPNVVQVHDVGEHDGDVFVAMELIEGGPLGEWCRQARGFREVLDAYLDAARGLAAAHAKGIVHRDVKPSNILRGDDGRVRVVDFGLAAMDRRRDTGPETGLFRPDGVGAPMGTPLYMSPEQHAGTRTTAASDQYSLAVALYEGLYGTPPFQPERGTSGPGAVLQLAELKRQGLAASPPAGSNVPAWVHQVLSRALAPEPAARFPSMDALIEALAGHPEPAPAPRRWPWALGAALAIGVVAAVWAWPREDPCAHPERELEHVWSAPIATQVRDHFLATGRPYAEDTARRVVERADRYAAEWSAMRGEVCESARLGRERPAITRLRDDCLDRRRGQLQAISALLSERADPAVLDRSVAAIAQLPPVAYCADTVALADRVPPPDDPAVRAQVAEMEPEVNRLEALRLAGRYKDGLAAGAAVLTRAESVGYAPMLAQVQLRMGQLADGAGDYEAARRYLRNAAVTAAEGRDDSLAVTAWSWLLFVVGDRLQNLDEAVVIESLGATVVVRAKNERAEAGWLNSAGLVLANAGRHADGKAMVERALALRERLQGPDHPDVTATLNNLANIQFLQGDLRGALVVYERIRAMAERVQGPEHPDVAVILYNDGSTRDALGDWPGALTALTRALEIRERAIGPDHPAVASTLSNLGVTYLHLGQFADAKRVFAHALAIKEKVFGPDQLTVAFAHSGLGRAEVGLRELDSARAHLDRAVAIMEKRQGPTCSSLDGPLLAQGELALAEDQPARAVAVLDRAVAVAEEGDFRCEIRLVLAEALRRTGDATRARATAEAARDGYRRIGHAPGLERAERFLR